MRLIHKRPAALTIDDLFAEAVHLSRALVESLHRDRDTRQYFPALQFVLQSLPLAQDEFAWASCRLTNAAEYVAHDERHAAAWEIGQLHRRLLALTHTSVSHNHNHNRAHVLASIPSTPRSA